MSLTVENLYKSFGSVQALRGMDFTANAGEIFGFVGSNGAGKTTTMRIILGVLKADSGKVSLDGRELDFSLRTRFGYMPEERGLYPRMKVQPHLEYLAKLQGLSSAEARKAVLHWTERLGVAHRRNDRVQNLSLGNQQRVQLCAALVHNPDFLVLDEPFSGLDPLAVDTMGSILREKAREGTTVIFSSHQLDLVERLCDRIGICSLGKTVSEGDIDSLRETPFPIYDVTTSADAHSVREALLTLGLKDVKQHGGHTFRITLPQGFDDQTLLHAMLDLAPVHGFSRYRPHLNELFSNIVSVPGTDTKPEKKPARKGLLGFIGRK